jgi:hypothetical protein
MRLIVTAAASPIFGNFLMLVSVSAETDGKATTGLKPANFKVHHLASLNHAHPNQRDVTKASEGPAGFYTLTLQPKDYQPDLPPGHYVFAVAVTAGAGKPTTGRGKKPAAPTDFGQTIAEGDLPTYGQWK